MSLPPPPYQVGLDQMYAYTGGTVPTSQMHPVCWNHPLIEYDQKNVLFTQFMREGFQIQLVKL